VTLVEIEQAAGVLEILRCWIDNEDSEVSEQWAVSLVTKSVDGTNVTAPTVVAHDLAMAAHGSTVRGMCTTVGTIDNTIIRRGFNVLNGWEWIPSEDEKLWIASAKTFGIHLPVAPVTSTTISVGLTYKVHG
jgi:hypothetical protein